MLSPAYLIKRETPPVSVSSWCLIVALRSVCTVIFLKNTFLSYNLIQRSFYVLMKKRDSKSYKQMKKVYTINLRYSAIWKYMYTNTS